MPKLGNNPERMHFIAEANAKGYIYVRAYKTQWDPVKKQSRAYGKRHVGRLHEDGRVAICDAFKKDYPQYAQEDWYWGPDKRLISKAEYRAYFPEEMLSEDALEAQSPEVHTVMVGATWAMQSICDQHKLLDDLYAVFEEKAAAILGLAFYKIQNHGGFEVYPIWHSSVLLPTLPSLSSESIGEILTDISQQKIEAFYRLRQKRSAKHRYYAFDNTLRVPRSDMSWSEAMCDSTVLRSACTLVCSQDSGEILYTHRYPRDISEDALFNALLAYVSAEGFDWARTVLMTERSYSSFLKAQERQNLDIAFIQGVSCDDEAVKLAIDEHWASLHALDCYHEKCGLYAKTIQMPLETKGTVKDLYLHLYCVESTKDGLSKAPPYEACFAIRTNTVLDPIEALNRYRMRIVAEKNVDIGKQVIDSEHVGACYEAELGKDFVTTLAGSIRLMMIHRMAVNQTEGMISGESLNLVLRKLDQLMADKTPEKMAYVVRPIRKEQQDLFSLLGVTLPPEVIH